MRQLRVALQQDGFVALRGHARKRWLELGQVGHRGAGAVGLVLREHGAAEPVAHGHERAVEAALGLRHGGAALAFHGVGIDRLAVHAVEHGHEVGRHAVGDVGVALAHGGVGVDRAAVAADGHA
ncbi:hypothetical protein D3C72_1531710 [compost metagenome]